MPDSQRDLFVGDTPVRPDFSFEDMTAGRGFAAIAGIDEVGRGPWAGPVIAAAVILRRDTLDERLPTSLDDSKKLTAKRREALFEILPGCAHIGIGRAEVDEIDRDNILNASLLAMARAVAELDIAPDFALVDGNREPGLPCPVQCVVRGDGRSLSIAAASVIAKVTRDRLMCEFAAEYPGYGWERNAGYGTAQHKAALERLGVTPQHRRSFAPILKILRRRTA